MHHIYRKEHVLALEFWGGGERESTEKRSGRSDDTYKGYMKFFFKLPRSFKEFHSSIVAAGCASY
jgi:hypothetical protein